MKKMTLPQLLVTEACEKVDQWKDSLLTKFGRKSKGSGLKDTMLSQRLTKKRSKKRVIRNNVVTNVGKYGRKGVDESNVLIGNELG